MPRVLLSKSLSRIRLNTNQELDFRNPYPKSSLSYRFNSDELETSSLRCQISLNVNLFFVVYFTSSFILRRRTMKNFVSKVLRWRLLPLIALLSTVACALVLTVPAWAATVTNIDIPFNTTLFNPCNGESVTLSGIAHELSQVTFNGSGGFHLEAHFNGNLTGTGTLGNTYVGNLEENVVRNGPSLGVSDRVFTHTFTTRLISEGLAPNFLTSVLGHFTVNPDGTTTVSFDNFTTE